MNYFQKLEEISVVAQHRQQVERWWVQDLPDPEIQVSIGYKILP